MSNDNPTSEWLALVRSRLDGIAERQDLPTRLRDLEAIDRAIVEARQLRNARAWPRTLPSEIWVKVFMQCRSLWYTGRYIDQPFRFGWMTVTHVCSSWRQIALGAPILWTDLTFNALSLPHQFVPDILARAGSAPLDVSIYWQNNRPTPRDLNIWLSSSTCRRVRTLSLSGAAAALETAIAHLSHSTPHLSYLSLSCNEEVPATLASSSLKDAPRLRRLALTNCELPRSLPPSFRYLAHLSIHSREGYLPPYSTLRDVLTLPGLQRIDLSDIVPINDTTQSSFPTLVLSEDLRRFDFQILNQEPAVEGIFFVSCLQFPWKCSCSIEICAYEPPDVIEPLLHGVLSRLLPRLSFSGSPNSMKATHVFLGDIDYLQICSTKVEAKLSRVGRRMRGHSSADEIINDITIRLADVQRAPLYSLVAHSRFLTLDTLRGISISSSAISALNEPTIAGELHRAANISRLDIHPFADEDHRKLLDVLSRSYEVAAGSGPRVLFPKLETVVWQYNPRYSAEDVVQAVAILDFLRCRSEQGAPIREIAIPPHVSHWAVWHTVRSTARIAVTILPE
ncbi:unnamed protein product [Peniophora sp. CBMAI 1063]|nr:unnamed protein product [Peniophora sp. CBMAI 1063]